MAYSQTLTPEQIQAILNYQGGSTPGSAYGSQLLNGMQTSSTGVEQTGEGGTSYNPSGFMQYNPADQNKKTTQYMGYDLGGKQTGIGYAQEPGYKDFALPLAAAASMFFGPEIYAAVAGGDGAAIGAANALSDGTYAGANWGAMQGAGGALTGGAAGTGATEMLSPMAYPDVGSIPSLGDTSFSGGMGGMGASGAGGAGGAGGGLGSGSGAFLGDGMASGVPSWDTAAKAAGLSLATTPGAGFSLSSLGSLIGPAASILGAVAGSKGTQSTTTKAPWAPLIPYITGQGGLLPGAQSLFAQQTAPGGLPGYGQMQSVGQGLLSQPIAGNGVAQFQAMPRFGGK